MKFLNRFIYSTATQSFRTKPSLVVPTTETKGMGCLMDTTFPSGNLVENYLVFLPVFLFCLFFSGTKLYHHYFIKHYLPVRSPLTVPSEVPSLSKHTVSFMAVSQHYLFNVGLLHQSSSYRRTGTLFSHSSMEAKYLVQCLVKHKALNTYVLN